MTWEDWNEDEEKRVIPKIPGNRFLMENWNAGFCACFADTPEELLKMHIIGWCPASKVFCRHRRDEEEIAIMLKDNTWCHLPIIFITDFNGIYNKEFWRFEGLEIKDDNEF